MTNRSPDATDRKILKLLSENGRSSYSELGAQLGLSRTAIRKRVAALEAAGLISGYHAAVTLPPEDAVSASRKEKTYILYFETEKAELNRITEALQEQQGIFWTAKLAGKENLTALIRVENRQVLQKRMQEFSGQLTGILRMRAQEVLETQACAGLQQNTMKKERADEKRTADYTDDGAGLPQRGGAGSAGQLRKTVPD